MVTTSWITGAHSGLQWIIISAFVIKCKVLVSRVCNQLSEISFSKTYTYLSDRGRIESPER